MLSCWNALRVLAIKFFPFFSVYQKLVGVLFMEVIIHPVKLLYGEVRLKSMIDAFGPYCCRYIVRRTLNTDEKSGVLGPVSRSYSCCHDR